MVERLTHPLGFALLNLWLYKETVNQFYPPNLKQELNGPLIWSLKQETGDRSIATRGELPEGRHQSRPLVRQDYFETGISWNQLTLPTHACLKPTKDVQVKGRNKDARSLGGKISHNNLQLTTIWTKK